MSPKHQFFMVVLVGGFLVVGFIYLAIILKYRRRAALSTYGMQRGLIFNEKADLSQVPSGLNVELFNRGVPDEASELVSGEIEGRDVWIFDYSYKTSVLRHQDSTGNNLRIGSISVSSRKDNKHSQSQYHTTTVVVIRCPGLKFPSFSVSPEGLFSKISQALGKQDLDLPEYPEFSKKYQVMTQDPELTLAILTPEIINWYESQRRSAFQFSGEHIVAFPVVMRSLSAADTIALHQEAEELAKLLHA